MTLEDKIPALLTGAGAGLAYSALVEEVTGGDGIGYAIVGANCLLMAAMTSHYNKEDNKSNYIPAQENSCSEN